MQRGGHNCAARRRAAQFMTSLPFTIRGVYTGFVDLEGIARLEERELCLEFRMSSVFTRYVKSKPREVRIALDELEEAAFKNRLCLGFLKLRARRLGAFSGVPGNDGGELRLRCRREHWEAARELASRLSMRTVQQQLRALVADNERASERIARSQRPGEMERGKSQERARETE